MTKFLRHAARTAVIVLTAAGLIGFGAAAATASDTAGDQEAITASERAERCAVAARDAGWTGDDLVVSVAVALAESGCEPGASGSNPPTDGCPNGSTDRGAWQLNDCYNDWVSDECAYDLNCNAEAAFQIYQDWGGFGAWVTYNEGIYQQYMTEAQEGVDATG